MLAQPSTYPILRTKLHRPPPTTDFVERQALVARLEAGRDLPLTLVSAPAGYGKTTLISHWLEASDAPSAWVSFDETDSDIAVFLQYVVSAVRSLFPEACEHLSRLVTLDDLPPLAHLAGALCNDLDAIGEPFVLALDDFHRIRGTEVNELVDRMLKHPPRGLRLVILCRRDPPLSLVSLRAQNRLTEIRMRDLRFTRDESATFLGASIGRSFDPEALARLQSSTEGWPVALRLSAVALSHAGAQAGEVVEGLSDSREVQRYLVSEVLARQSPIVRHWLCKTSILDRFCAPLCEAVCGSAGDTEDAGDGLDGDSFLDLLEERSLLSVALDDRRQWLRFHHLFQESLQNHLDADSSVDEIAALHRRAAAWFESQGLIEEALHHLLATNDLSAAGRLIVRLRGEIAEHELWNRLDRWLSLLASHLVAEDPELLLLKAWSSDYRAHYSETQRLLEEVEALLSEQVDEDARERRLRGEIAALRSRNLYIRGQVGAVREQAEEALRLLPRESRSERGYAAMMLAGAMQREGKIREAHEMLHEILEQDTRDSPAYRGRILFTLCAIQWMDADLMAVEQTCSALLKLGTDQKLVWSVHTAMCFQGMAKYQSDQLTEAEKILTALVSEDTAVHFRFMFLASYALALLYDTQGRSDQARETLDSVIEQLLERGNTSVLPFLRAVQADLALRQGRLAEAMRWAENYRARELPRGTEFYWLELTAVRAFIEQGTPAYLAKASDLLDALRHHFESTHNQRFLIDLDTVQAVLHDRRGEDGDALATLERAVDRAQPGRCIRLFVDLGPGLADLFRRLEVTGDTQRYVEEILAAYQKESLASSTTQPALARALPVEHQPLIEPLTPRELEVLAGLVERLTNKEIAHRLGISSITVKRHANNIYQKLEVHGRREAATKALDMGLLETD